MTEVLPVAPESTSRDSLFGKDNPDMGQTLIRALTNFIVPLVQGNMPAPVIGADAAHTNCNPIAEDPPYSVASTARSDSALTMEEQHFLSALKRFAESLVYSQKAQKDEQNLTGNSDHILQEDSATYGSSTTLKNLYQSINFLL
ncbi:hypothetical protein HYPSUDRAFT_851841 [Hypholoma sublateritium FD-334 SS-4]|uniref:Uncharacterized protein n=1 Tax=Hypholoma sublateritium (strain FD-334 SS-4) TaxID=945553 RepID=A0A0D2PIJ6_HYPSF|nr:hypothetical protein HYPSUDRAFT_851841 [Hypholoma sublateritium FD-334 SS-4]